MPIKITLDEVLQTLKNNNFELLNINEFKNTNTIGHFKCNLHNIEWSCGIRYTLKNIKYCKECKQSENKLSLNEILMLKGFKLNKKLENQYGEFECLYGHKWKTQINHIVSSLSGCKECYRPKITLEMVKEKINNIIKINNLIMLDDYINSSTIYKFKCNNEHTFTSSWNNMKQRYKKGCRICKKK